MSEPRWIGMAETLAIHDRLIGEHGGAAGLRDRGSLEAALARARQLFAYGTPDLFDLGASYAAAIVGNHPFVDGNKRTGFVIAILFLELNGLSFAAAEADAVRAMTDLAARDITDAAFADWLRDNCRTDTA